MHTYLSLLHRDSVCVQCTCAILHNLCTYVCSMTHRNSIGGPLGLAEYEALAAVHRPSDPAAMAAEIRRLAASGLTPRDVASALRLPLDLVINTLEASA